jgi:hypothetical protein
MHGVVCMVVCVVAWLLVRWEIWQPHGIWIHVAANHGLHILALEHY